MNLDSMQDIAAAARKEGKKFWEIILETDMANRGVSRGMSLDKMAQAWHVMREASEVYTGDRRSLSGMAGGQGKLMHEYAGKDPIGGGRIMVDKLDGVWVSFSGDYHTLIIQNMDNQSNLADVTTALSLARVNVANMSMHRSVKGGSVMTIVETDDPIPGYIVELLEKQPGILQVIHYRKEEE